MSMPPISGGMSSVCSPYAVQPRLFPSPQVTSDSRRRNVLAEDAAFAPWQESSWSQRATQGLDAQGQDWFDQPGAFVGGGYMGAVGQRRVAGAMLAEDAAFAPWQESSWSSRATQGLDAQGQDW